MVCKTMCNHQSLGLKLGNLGFTSFGIVAHGIELRKIWYIPRPKYGNLNGELGLNVLKHQHKCEDKTILCWLGVKTHKIRL